MSGTKRVRVDHTAGSLAKVGVGILEGGGGYLLECRICLQIWSPMQDIPLEELTTRRRLPRGWWHCPNGRNHPSKEPASS